MRRKRIEEEQKRNSEIKENQLKLMEQKMAEIEERVKSGNFD